MAIKDIQAQDLRELIRTKGENLEIIDVRQPEEYDIIHIRGSKLIPMNELQGRLSEIDWGKEVVFVCRSGSRSKLMASIVAQGRDVDNLRYGIYECFADGQGENLEIDERAIGTYF